MLALVVAVAGPLQSFAVRVQLQANSSDAALADVSLNSTATEEQMTGGACCCCYAPQNMFGGFKYTCPDKEWIRTKVCYPYAFPGDYDFQDFIGIKKMKRSGKWLKCMGIDREGACAAFDFDAQVDPKR